MLVIDFWVNFCVFPRETQQFPKRMTANSWHVAENPRAGAVVGFSGTNDNHRLLPLQVRQAKLEEPSLKGTNGRMLDLVLRHTNCYTTLSADPVSSLDGGIVITLVGCVASAIQRASPVGVRAPSQIPAILPSLTPLPPPSLIGQAPLAGPVGPSHGVRQCEGVAGLRCPDGRGDQQVR